MPTRHQKKTASRTTTHDVIIIGGGLSGGTMACLLGNAGLRVACIDEGSPATHASSTFDGRTIAISWGSRKIVDRAGLWDELEGDACPINRIDILDGNSPVLLDFHSDEVNDQVFGWIVENRLLRQAIFNGLKNSRTIDHMAPVRVLGMNHSDDIITVTIEGNRTLSAPLAVGADGRASWVREQAGIGLRSWPYHQNAIVCTVEHEYPHNNLAVEHFRSEAPFAILPMTDGKNGAYRSSVVWTEHRQHSGAILSMPQDVFDIALTARFPKSYGRVRQIGKHFTHPLSLSHAHRYTAPRLALIADAAHSIHPIAGQGLNLGFRDIDSLCSLILASVGGDIGGDMLLAEYERARRIDNMAMAAATDGLNRLFSSRTPFLSDLRRIGIGMVAKTPITKRFFMHQAMGARSGSSS